MKYRSMFMVAGLLPIIAITVLSLLDPSFVLFRDYISQLGTGQYAFLFNGTLVITALLAAPFLFSQENKYQRFVFLVAVASLALVGLFPMPSPVHWLAAAGFFVLTFISIAAAGLKAKRPAREVSLAIAVLGMIGLLFFNPLIETLQIFAIGIWVAATGWLSKG